MNGMEHRPIAVVRILFAFTIGCMFVLFKTIELNLHIRLIVKPGTNTLANVCHKKQSVACLAVFFKADDEPKSFDLFSLLNSFSFLYVLFALSITSMNT